VKLELVLKGKGWTDVNNVLFKIRLHRVWARTAKRYTHVAGYTGIGFTEPTDVLCIKLTELKGELIIPQENILCK
jgi:hypothetical protein